LYHEMLQRRREQPNVERSELHGREHVTGDQRPMYVFCLITQGS
jgi:hypothetical protein